MKNINESSDNLSAFDCGLAGAISGVFTRFTCQPFDVIKIRFQLQTSSRHARKYKSIIQTVRQIGKEEGFKSLWKGHVPAQVLSAVYGAAQFATYEKLTRPWQNKPGAHFAGGAASGIVAVLASYPFDIIRTRLVAQGEPKIYFGMIDTTKKIIAAEGAPVLIRGIIPALVSTTPLSALVFGFNNIFISIVRSLTGDATLAGTLGCGAVAGVCGKAVVYPMDVIKKRMQASGMPEGASAVPLLRVSGILSTIKRTWKAERLYGLYKGFTPSLIKAAVSNAVYLSSYDQFRKLLVSLHHR